MSDSKTEDQRVLDEYDAQEGARCDHGCLPGEWCEDCAHDAIAWYSVWWKLPCGADV